MLAGRGAMLTTPSRTIHSRPPTACWIDSQPGVMEVDRVTGSPGSRVPSADRAGAVTTTVPGSIGQPPSAGLTLETNPVHVPDGRRGSANPLMTRSIPEAAVLVRLLKCGVYRTISLTRRSWLTRLMTNCPAEVVLRVTATRGEPRIGRPSGPTPNVGRPAVPAVTSSPASTWRPLGAASMSFE